MTSSPGKEWREHDTAKHPPASPRRALAWMAAVLLGVATVAAFVGYRQPELLLEFVNVRYCG